MTHLFISLGRSQLVMVATLLAMAVGVPRLGAAVSLGPVITNPAEAKQHQSMVEYEAEQSDREKLKVGQERYKLKQAQKASILAGMTAQLHAQQQVVVFPSTPTVSSDPAKTIKWYLPPLFLAMLAVILLGAGFYLKYRRYQRTKTSAF